MISIFLKLARFNVPDLQALPQSKINKSFSPIYIVAGPLDFGGWMSRYRMRLCQACFGIRANFPSIPFNTTYPTTDDNFYLIHSFFHPQNDKSRYSDLSYLLI